MSRTTTEPAPTEPKVATFAVVKGGVGNMITPEVGAPPRTFYDELDLLPADVTSWWPSMDKRHTFARVVLDHTTGVAKTFQLDVLPAEFGLFLTGSDAKTAPATETA
jgi:hypothetical protein